MRIEAFGRDAYSHLAFLRFNIKNQRIHAAVNQPGDDRQYGQESEQSRHASPLNFSPVEPGPVMGRAHDHFKDQKQREQVAMLDVVRLFMSIPPSKDGGDGGRDVSRHFELAQALRCEAGGALCRCQPVGIAVTLASPHQASTIHDRLGDRVVVFVGLMGAGKTAIGRKVAQALQLPFVDSDHEIETVSRMTVPELFERYGEPEFRALEQRVIERLLREGPRVVSTGGGAFMNAQTREAIAEHGISIWLKADLDLLMERVAKKQNRPLLKNADPRAIMAKLMADRYPVYALADVTVATRDAKRELITEEVLQALGEHLKLATRDETRTT